MSYAVLLSTAIGAALAFLQVAVSFTPETVAYFMTFAVMFALSGAVIGAISGVLAGLAALLAMRIVRRGSYSARRMDLAVAGALALGSLPGLALAVWMTGQFALEQHEPTAIQWIEFAIALVVFLAGGVLLVRRSRANASATSPRPS